MVVNTVVEDVLDGAVSVLTLEARDEKTIMSCHFEISESGDRASLKECSVFSDETRMLEEAFSMIILTLKKNGVESVEVERVNDDMDLQIPSNRWLL